MILLEISPDYGWNADVHLHVAKTSVVGGVAEGVLGVTEAGGNITLISGWNYYLGDDPGAVPVSD